MIISASVAEGRGCKACPLGFFSYSQDLSALYPALFRKVLESRLIHSSIYVFIYPLSKYLLSTYYVSGTALGAEDTATQKADSHSLHEAYILTKQKDERQTSK